MKYKTRKWDEHSVVELQWRSRNKVTRVTSKYYTECVKIAYNFLSLKFIGPIIINEKCLFNFFFNKIKKLMWY